ncbi:MAG: ferritin-like domain-containing protein [Candidatus Saccharicenans sp.]
MQKIKLVNSKEDLIKYLNIALEHEWAVSFEYVIHAYSMPKGKYFYQDPVMKCRLDARAQTIQIGIDEMYHALQIGLWLKQLGGEPSFKTDVIKRYPRIIDNLKRDKMTEDEVTALYQEARFENINDPKLQNMVLNIAADEARHSQQFQAMIKTLESQGLSQDLCYQPNPEADQREDLRLLHELCQLENRMMHEYLYYVLLFSEHQDLGQRLFKNSINHMRHWDKLSGILVKLGDVLRLENPEPAENGAEQSRLAMPSSYPGKNRTQALESTLNGEKLLIEKYEKALNLVPEGELRTQLQIHLSLCREHAYTQSSLLENARRLMV